MSGCKDLCQLRFYFFWQSPQFPVERYRCQNWITARNATDREYRPEIMDSQAGEGFEEDQAAGSLHVWLLYNLAVLGARTNHGHTPCTSAQASTGIIENAREILKPHWYGVMQDRDVGEGHDITWYSTHNSNIFGPNCTNRLLLYDSHPNAALVETI